MTVMYIIWAVAIVFFAVAEALTAQLVSVWFVVGSVGGLVAALCKAPVWLQVVVFIVISVAMLLATRPLVAKKVKPKVQSTNADMCIGKEAVVTQDIVNLEALGQVKVQGKEWSARSLSGEVIPAGTTVIVEKIEGVKLIVKLN